MARRLIVEEATGSLHLEELAHPEAATVGTRSLRETFGAYFALTKPRIIELLLITTVPAMIVAEDGVPRASLIVATLVGGALAAGGANAINCYFDRDIDEVMHRTRRRPLPLGKVEPLNALLFGLALGVIAGVLLWSLVNPLSAVLALGALAFYVVIYTVVLKRTTPQNIVIGGAAGAIPVLVGWSAVTGTVELPALAMFAVIFYWTPPHFWALSMRYERDYAAAGVPMMPVVYGRKETARHILLYSFLLFAMCLAFFSVARLGVVFLASSLVLNAAFIGFAIRLYRRQDARAAWALFKFSIYYLALLFAAAAVDVLALGG